MHPFLGPRIRQRTGGQPRLHVRRGAARRNRAGPGRHRRGHRRRGEPGGARARRKLEREHRPYPERVRHGRDRLERGHPRLEEARRQRDHGAHAEGGAWGHPAHARWRRRPQPDHRGPARGAADAAGGGLSLRHH